MGKRSGTGRGQNEDDKKREYQIKHSVDYPGCEVAMRMFLIKYSTSWNFTEIATQIPLGGSISGTNQSATLTVSDFRLWPTTEKESTNTTLESIPLTGSKQT